MAGPFHLYFDAARALWNAPMKKLYFLAEGDARDPMKRAADLTLRLKTEFMTPEAFTVERAALTKLAAALSDDPKVTVDVALKLSKTLGGSGRGESGGRRQPLKGAPQTRPWKVAMWVSVIAASMLLVMDVLATAGVPVPTPIGVLIDRFTSDNPPYLPPEPMRDREAPGPSIPIDGDGTPSDPVTDVRPVSSRSPIRLATSSEKEVHRQDVKNAHHADGRNVHQAQGRDVNQAKGKEQHFANGKLRHPNQGKAVGRATGRVRAEARHKLRNAGRRTR